MPTQARILKMINYIMNCLTRHARNKKIRNTTNLHNTTNLRNKTPRHGISGLAGFLLFFASLSLMLTLPSAPAWAQTSSPVTVFIDGLPLEFDVPPLIKEGRTLVPFRAIAEGLRIQVDWNETTQTVTGKTATQTLLLKIGDHTAYLNGQALSLDVPPEINNARTLIPLRVFSETLGFTVDWLEHERTIKIFSPPSHMPVTGFYALGSSETSSWKNLFGTEFPQAGVGNTKNVSKLALGWYSLDEKGALLTKSTTGWQRPGGWETVLDAAERYHLQTEMVVHMTDQNGSLRKLIADPAATAQAVANIAAEAGLYDGVNLDLEGLGWQEQGETLAATRADFTNFVKLLYQKLQANQTKKATLTLTLHAPNSAYPGYDYQALANWCNEIIIMAYDYGPKPEPLPLVQGAIESALRMVPAHKLLLGISLPSERAESLQQKIGLAKRYGLKGIALWRLGLVSPEMWSVLERR